jgi:ornithine decarboxylase
MKNAAPWPNPRAHLIRQTPDAALLYFSPDRLQATARDFQAGFPGLVTYAVKANPGAEVLANLVAAGITAFDVASPEEMRAVRDVCPDAVLHYNNPVRSVPEIEIAAQMGVRSYSIDCLRELDKLTGRAAPDAEITVRLALPVRGAAYDFGAKFGVGPERAAELLRAVAERGFIPSMTFHPGTQCADPAAWGAYIGVVADVARAAGVRLARINVGGGFASHRIGAAPDLSAIFAHIGAEVARVFGADAPALVCVLAPDGTTRTGAPRLRVVFGPTCDSIDRLPDPLPLPGDLDEGDYLLISGMGAYTRSLSTDFNGYGLREVVTVAQL